MISGANPVHYFNSPIDHTLLAFLPSFDSFFSVVSSVFSFDAYPLRNSPFQDPIMFIFSLPTIVRGTCSIPRHCGHSIVWMNLSAVSSTGLSLPLLLTLNISLCMSLGHINPSVSKIELTSVSKISSLSFYLSESWCLSCHRNLDVHP